MSRALLILNSQIDREKAIHWIQKAPAHTRVTFQAHKRSTDQNSKMWAMLTEVSEQATHMGQRYTPDQWKILFMYACGREVQFLPGLDGKTFLPWGQSTSDLSKDEMTDLIEFIHAWGAENGVTFHDPDQSDAGQSRSGADASPECPPADAEGDETPSQPCSSPSTHTEADSSRDASDEGGGNPPPSPSPTLMEFAGICYRIVANKEFPTDMDTFMDAVNGFGFKQKAPEEYEKAETIVRSYRAVINDKTSLESASEFLAEMLGCAVEDFEKKETD